MSLTRTKEGASQQQELEQTWGGVVGHSGQPQGLPAQGLSLLPCSSVVTALPWILSSCGYLDITLEKNRWLSARCKCTHFGKGVAT